MKIFNTLADLQAARFASTGQLVQVKGTDTTGDGGIDFFLIQNSGTPDGVDVFATAGSKVAVRQKGAKASLLAGRAKFTDTTQFATGTTTEGIVANDATWLSLVGTTITVETQGFHSGSTVGGAKYKFLNAADSTAAGYVDGSSRFQLRALDVYACLVIGVGMNFEQFGTIGDGGNDDRPIIIHALTIAKNFKLNAGKTYKLPSKATITGLDGLVIDGSKSTILNFTDACDLEFQNSSNITIKHLKFDGNGTGTGGGAAGANLALLNCEKVVIDDCDFENVTCEFGYGLVHNRTNTTTTKFKKLHVSNSRFKNINRDGLQTKSVTDVGIVNCDFEDCNGAATDHHPFGGGVPQGENLTISNCTIKNCGDAYSIGNKNTTITGGTVTGCNTLLLFNTMDGTISGVTAYDVNYALFSISDDTTSGRKLVLTNNNIQCNSKYIEVTGNGAIDLTIKNNTLYGAATEFLIRRTGVVRITNNDIDTPFRITDDGVTATSLELHQDLYVTVNDGAGSGDLTRFLGNANFGGMLVKLEDVTAFNDDFSGACGYDDVSPVGVRSVRTYTGANCLFKDFKPTAVDAGNVQIGCDASGVFAIRNDSGSNKKFKLTLQK